MTWLKRIFGSAGRRAASAAPLLSEPRDNLHRPLRPPKPAGAVAPPMPPDPVAERPQQRRISVGKAPHNDIVLEDNGISRTHMYLIIPGEDGADAKLIDTYSPSGVYVRRHGVFVRVTGSANVALDDTIRLGELETTVQALLDGRASGLDIFISYAREDEPFAKDLERALRQHGWRLWRDDRLAIGRSFDEEIEARLTAARCVVVLWSARSVKSQWVRAEASVALDRRVLVPVFIEEVEPPLIFRQIQGCFLTECHAEALGAQRRVLIEKLERMIGPPKA